MLKYLAGYLGAGLAFAAIDAVWLTTMTNRLYKPILGPILADKPDMKAAVAFYLIYLAGTVFFAVTKMPRQSFQRAMRAVSSASSSPARFSSLACALEPAMSYGVRRK